MQKLGKGLSALLGGSQIMESSSEYLQFIDLDLIDPNPNQPRKEFNDERIYELSESIKINGLLQPIVVYKEENRYKIIAGERRFRAASLINLQKIPCIVKQVSETEFLELSLIENIQRENLNPIEEATAYIKLINDFGYRQEDLAKNLSKSRSYISNTTRLATLPEDIKQKVIDRSISAGHARALLSAEDPYKILDMILAKDLSVRQVENLVKQQKNALNKNEVDVDEQNRAAEEMEELEKIAENLSTKLEGIQITFTKTGAEYIMKLGFSNLKYLDLILSKLS